MKKLILILIAIIGINSLSIGQLIVGAQIRPRFEYRNGFKTLTNSDRVPASFIEQRSRLHFDYSKDKIKLRLSVQDVRFWGATAQIYKSDPTLTNLNEAYAQYSIDNKWSLRLGRQHWDYDNARILGDLDWAQQARSHDGLLLTYKNDSAKLKIDVGVAYNQPNAFEPTKLSGNEYIGTANYKNLQFIHANKQIDDFNITVLALNMGSQVASDTSIVYLQTFGTNTAYKISDNLSLGFEGFYQIGQNTAKQDVNAYLLAFNATYKHKKGTITPGIDHLSGTDAKAGKVSNSFDPLFGTHHKFYGYMDYFYVGNFHGQATGRTSGLNDIYIDTRTNVSTKGNINAVVHLFNSAADLFNNNGSNASSYLGTEIDLVYKHTVQPDLAVFVGYSQLFATESMELIKPNGDHKATNNWAWIMVNFSPKLLMHHFKD